MNKVHAIFIRDAVVPARVSEALTGVPASVTIAQAIVESAWGRHYMGKAKNYFGVKAQTSRGKIVYGDIATGYVDRSTKEHVKKSGTDITITAHFRSYADMRDSFCDHGLFIHNNKRYHKAISAYAQTKDADEFARGLQEAGYATDPNYAELLISIMTRYKLYQYNASVLRVGLP